MAADDKLEEIYETVQWLRYNGDTVFCFLMVPCDAKTVFPITFSKFSARALRLFSTNQISMICVGRDRPRVSLTWLCPWQVHNVGKVTLGSAWNRKYFTVKWILFCCYSLSAHSLNQLSLDKYLHANLKIVLLSVLMLLVPCCHRMVLQIIVCRSAVRWK